MKQTVILKNKLFLYLTEFFAGMSVMAVELGASRLLAPYFSSSQIVWTIIIGTIMIAMALGNIYGGRSADKSPNPDRLYTRILIAAIWICSDSGGGQIYRARNLGTFDFYGEQSFFDHCSVCSMYGHLCISSFLTGNRDTVACKICGGQSG